MDIIQSTRISSTSAANSPLSSTYAVSNVANDQVGKPFISSATSETITISADAGARAIFLFGLMADTALIECATTGAVGTSLVLNTAQYSSIDQLQIGTSNLIPPEYIQVSSNPYSGTVLSSPLTSDTQTTDSTTGAPNTLELAANLTIGDGQEDSQQLVIGLDTDPTVEYNDSGSALGAATVELKLTTSTDRKDSAVAGDNIGYWQQDSGTTGRFAKDSSSASSSSFVNVNNHGNVRIGSHVTIGGTSYQITKIVGDGTASGGITLSGSPSSATVTSLLNPIKLGLFRMGTRLNVGNPQIGLQKSFADFSYKRALGNGGYTQIQRNVATIYTITANLTRAQCDSLVDHFRAYRSKPFPVLVMDGMPDAQNERTKYSGFFYMPEAPSIQFIDKRVDRQNINFRLREIT
jgi:hypothetical protein